MPHGDWELGYVQDQKTPHPAHVSGRHPLKQATFLTSEVLTFEQHNRRAAYDRLQTAARLTRTWGDGYGYLMVATGRADVMVDPVMALWDSAALSPILEEAGWHLHRLDRQALLPSRRRHRHQWLAAGRSFENHPRPRRKPVGCVRDAPTKL